MAPEKAAVERVGGAARGYSWPAAEPGNTLAVTHAFYSRIRDEDAPELEAIAEAIREAMRGAGSYASTFEPSVVMMAGRVLLRARAYAVALEQGVERVAPSLLKNLIALEGKLQRDVEMLGLSVRSAADLQLTVARAHATDRERIELGRLSDQERRELSRLLEKAAVRDA
jgi:hypothetical protein